MRKAPSFHDAVMAAGSGNAARHRIAVTLASAPAGTEIAMLELPVGTRIDGLKLFHDALGAGVKLDVGLVYPDGTVTDAPKALFDQADAAAKGVKTSEARPILTEERAYLVIKTAAAEATGSIEGLLEYVFIGNSFA